MLALTLSSAGVFTDDILKLAFTARKFILAIRSRHIISASDEIVYAVDVVSTQWDMESKMCTSDNSWVMLQSDRRA